MDRAVMVGVELDGVIECMSCLFAKEDDDILDRAVVEGGLITARVAHERKLVCSSCGRKLTDHSILAEVESDE